MKKYLLFIAVILMLTSGVFAQDYERHVFFGQKMPISVTLMFDIGLIVGAATLLAYIVSIAKQPLIPAYILAGILIGPMGTKMIFGSSLIADPELISAFSQLGITFLLFTVGMELDLSRLKSVGVAASLGALFQVLLTFGVTFLIALFVLSFGTLDSVYLGMVMAFSSTMVVIKILSDNDDLETLHGRIMLGILLVQDLIIITALSVLSNPGDMSPLLVGESLFKGIGLFSLAIVMSRYVFPTILRIVSSSSEVLFLTALSTAFFFSGLAFLFLGPEATAIGGFLGGLSLAVFPYNLEVSNRVKTLRDFFSVLFFVSLGMQMSIQNFFLLQKLLVPILIFFGIVVLVKPILITMVVMLFGYERRTAFLSGISLAQISEFSIILALPLGANSPVFLITIILAVFTIPLTSYMIEFGNRIYLPFSELLAKFEKLTPIKRHHEFSHVPRGKERLSNHVVLFGAHTMGQEIINVLRKTGRDFLVIDYNPNIIRNLINCKIHCIYGDAEDMETLEKARLKNCSVLISTIPDEQDNKLLIEKIREANPKATVFVSAKSIDQALTLYDKGADYVIMLKLLAGRKVGKYLSTLLNEAEGEFLDKKRDKEVDYLRGKKKQEVLETFGGELVKDKCEIEDDKYAGDET